MPASLLTLQELKAHLWNCAQILRGSAVDRTDWKGYILPLYAAGTWGHQRRVVIKAEVVRLKGREPRDNPRFVVTNLLESSRFVYEWVYCARGDIENRIKEFLDGLQIDRTSCCKFLANLVAAGSGNDGRVPLGEIGAITFFGLAPVLRNKSLDPSSGTISLCLHRGHGATAWTVCAAGPRRKVPQPVRAGRQESGRSGLAKGLDTSIIMVYNHYYALVAQPVDLDAGGSRPRPPSASAHLPLRAGGRASCPRCRREGYQSAFFGRKSVAVRYRFTPAGSRNPGVDPTGRRRRSPRVREAVRVRIAGEPAEEGRPGCPNRDPRRGVALLVAPNATRQAADTRRHRSAVASWRGPCPRGSGAAAKSRWCCRWRLGCFWRSGRKPVLEGGD